MIPINVCTTLLVAVAAAVAGKDVISKKID